MYQRKESGKNTYYPSFLCMEVDTPGNILKLPDKYYAIFVIILHKFDSQNTLQSMFA